MDLNGLRSLNLIGTLLFGLFGFLTPVLYAFTFLFSFAWHNDDGFELICATIIIIWVIFIGIFTFFLYSNTVIALDEGKFGLAKRWVLFGAIAGFFCGGGVSLGLITLIVFIVSYISFDDAIRPKYYYPPPGYYPYPPPGYVPPHIQSQRNLYTKSRCPNCMHPIEMNWKYCPNCNVNLK